MTGKNKPTAAGATVSNGGRDAANVQPINTTVAGDARARHDGARAVGGLR